jgi:hypothetical protein
MRYLMSNYDCVRCHESSAQTLQFFQDNKMGTKIGGGSFYKSSSGFSPTSRTPCYNIITFFIFLVQFCSGYKSHVGDRPTSLLNFVCCIIQRFLPDHLRTLWRGFWGHLSKPRRPKTAFEFGTLLFPLAFCDDCGI